MTTSEFHASREFALEMDRNDPLGAFRDRYYLPRIGGTGEPYIYLTGNSLGLQPKSVRKIVDRELRDWAELGVEGHFEAEHPWYSYHEMFREPLAHVVGAMPQETVAMNTLTTNLHLMMVSFYRPTADRYKIVVEDGAFPSDQYAVASQAMYHGYNPDDAIILLRPRESEDTIRTEDIEQLLAVHGSQIALVMLGGVNYYTGQAFEMQRITAAAHAEGCLVGFDLAHAAGNMPLRLHDWDVDFAVWCSYKYLNSGPGGVGGCFVHERYACDTTLPRFSGWWGVAPETRFRMNPLFVPQTGAAGWQLSNAQIMAMAPHKAALDLFTEAGMPQLREKSLLLSGYLEFLIEGIEGENWSVITPRDPEQRGCQLSIRTRRDAKHLSEILKQSGTIVDFRPPDVIRVAPVPMYNTFQDVWRFARLLAELPGG